MALDLVYTGENSSSGLWARPVAGASPSETGGVFALLAQGNAVAAPASVVLLPFLMAGGSGPLLVLPVAIGAAALPPRKERGPMARRVEGLIWPRQFIGTRTDSGVLVPRRAVTPTTALIFDDGQTLIFDGQILILD